MGGRRLGAVIRSWGSHLPWEEREPPEMLKESLIRCRLHPDVGYRCRLHTDVGYRCRLHTDVGYRCRLHPDVGYTQFNISLI